MNRKQIELTMCVVSLFIGIGLIIIGNRLIVCLDLGCFVFAIGLILYMFIKSKDINTAIQKYTQMKNDEDTSVDEIERTIRKLKSNKISTWIVFGLLATLLVVASALILIDILF